MELLDKTKKNIKQANKEIVSQGLTMVSSAFILVAALAWNEAIRALINQYLKAGSGIISLFIYAITVTIVAVIVTTRLSKIAQRFKDEDRSAND